MLLKIRVSPKGVFDKLQAATEHPKPLLDIAVFESGKEIARRIHSRVRTNITQGRPEWQPLSKVTTTLKGSEQPLVETGQLRDSFQVIEEGDKVLVGIPEGTTRRDGKSMEMIAQTLEHGVTMEVTDAIRGFFAVSGFPLKLTTRFLVIPPRPFFQPAVDETEAEAGRILGPFVSKLLKELGR